MRSTVTLATRRGSVSADSSPLVALQHRNFRLIWGSQLVSMAGSMMQNAAILWHVSLLVPHERQGLALGMVGLVRIIPIVAFSLLSGVVADAVDRRKLMLITQSGMTLTAGALAAITFLDVHALWPIYTLTALSSAFGSFDGPARQSLIPSLVPREHLPNAISLNTIMFQTASVAGPALGGLVIARAGVGWVYASNAVSFLAVIGALLMMRDLPAVRRVDPSQISWQAAREGLRFVFTTPLIRSTMLLDFFATFFASATALLPIFAQSHLHIAGKDAQAQAYGWLASATAIGALVTSIALVPLVDRIRRRGATMLWSVVGFGLATIVFGLSHTFWLTFLCLALTGATDTVSMVIRNIIRQLNTPDAMRGRMTSVNMIFFMGGPQLGEFEAGMVASVWGAVASVVSRGIGCIVATAVVARITPGLRRYQRETPVIGERSAASA